MAASPEEINRRAGVMPIGFCYPRSGRKRNLLREGIQERNRGHRQPVIDALHLQANSRRPDEIRNRQNGIGLKQAKG